MRTNASESTGADTRSRVEKLQRQLTAEIESMQSGEDWRQMLQVASGLHRYSANNLILIAVQHRAALVPVDLPKRAWLAVGV